MFMPRSRLPLFSVLSTLCPQQSAMKHCQQQYGNTRWILNAQTCQERDEGVAGKRVKTQPFAGGTRRASLRIARDEPGIGTLGAYGFAAPKARIAFQMRHQVRWSTQLQLVGNARIADWFAKPASDQVLDLIKLCHTCSPRCWRACRSCRQTHEQLILLH